MLWETPLPKNLYGLWARFRIWWAIPHVEVGRRPDGYEGFYLKRYGPYHRCLFRCHHGHTSIRKAYECMGAQLYA